MSAQLELPALPVADPELERHVSRELRLRGVLESAHELEAVLGYPWWGGLALANLRGEPVAMVGNDLHVLRERGSIERELLCSSDRGRPVYLWAVKR